MKTFLLELKRGVLTTIIWLTTITAFTWVYFTMFETLSSDMLVHILADFPEEFLKAFGMDTDFTTVLGYFSMLGLYLVLFGAIFAANLGLHAVLPEEMERTADFLLTKPIIRSKLLTQKILADLIHLILFATTIGLSNYLFIRLYTGGLAFEIHSYLIMIFGIFLMEGLFFSLGLLISMLVKQLDSPLSVSVGLSVGCYILATFNTILDETFLGYIVPFSYVKFTYIAETGSMRSYGLVISLIVIVFSIAASYLLYERRNIASAT